MKTNWFYLKDVETGRYLIREFDSELGEDRYHFGRKVSMFTDDNIDKVSSPFKEMIEDGTVVKEAVQVVKYGFDKGMTEIAEDLSDALKRESDNQINKVELDFNKPNVAAVVKIKNLNDKEIATIKIGNSTITPRVSDLEQTTVNVKGVQSLSILSAIDFYADHMHKVWKVLKEEGK